MMESDFANGQISEEDLNYDYSDPQKSRLNEDISATM
jgi:hypothetical protein